MSTDQDKAPAFYHTMTQTIEPNSDALFRYVVRDGLDEGMVEIVYEEPGESLKWEWKSKIVVDARALPMIIRSLQRFVDRDQAPLPALC